MKLPYNVQVVLDTISQHNKEAYVVGGCVRDALLKKEPADYDITTSASPQEIQSWFSHTIPTGIQHGTITILMNQAIEVTTFRKESEYKDHRRPSAIEFVDTIEQDLARRDFTINAMAYHPKVGLVDPFGGRDDLEAGIIRCVGKAEQRFQEDALRMLRAHRFAARLHFTIEEKTMQAILDNEELLRYISVERIRHEMTEILRCNPYQIEKMTTLLKPWIPELETSLSCQQKTRYHDTNVLHHTCRAVAYLKPFDETLAYALLFHDLAKPQCKKKVGEKDSFKGHPLAGVEIAKRIARQWKMTNFQKKWIPRWVEYHDWPMHDPMAFIERFCIQLNWPHERIVDLFTIKRCDIMAHSPFGQKSIEQLERLEQVYQQVRKERVLSLKDLPINGKDIIDNFSKEGKEIQEILDACLSYGFHHPEMKEKEDYIEWLKGQSL